MSEKRCNGCGEVRPIDDFARDPSTRDGRKATCSPCRNEISRLRYAANPRPKRPARPPHRKGKPWKRINAGERVGRLVVAQDREKGDTHIFCVCECGTETRVPLTNWGKTQSCGCLKVETTISRSTSHGHAGTSIYMTWGDMVNRCTNPTHHHWDNYGGRGITVCDRWNPKRGGCFANFLADMGERPPGLTLDRIDNDRGYSPENCRWATTVQQRHNQRPHKRRTHCPNGHEYTSENSRTGSDGTRRCLTCAQETWERNREASNARKRERRAIARQLA